MWILQVYCHISAQTRQGRDEVCFKCGYLNLNFFSLSAESNVYSTYKDVLSSEYGDSWLYKTGKAIISVIRVCVHVFYAQLPCVLAFPCLCTCGQKTIQQELKENRWACVVYSQEALLSQQCILCWWSWLLLSAGAFCESQMEAFSSHQTSLGLFLII